MRSPLCRKCGTMLAPLWIERGAEYHAMCDPEPSSLDFDESPLPVGQASDHFSLRLRDDLIEMIKWADRNSERSRQTELGVSELGECLRRVGYRAAGVATVAAPGDPWPAIVGTAIHAWLEAAMQAYERDHAIGRWHTEMTVYPADDLKGHTDLYDAKTFTVVDYKSKGTEEMREIRKGAPPAEAALRQIYLYALGHVRAGRRVDKVALVYLPRGGWLEGMYVWSGPFDQAAAEAAVDSYIKVQRGIRYYTVTEQPENWAKFPFAVTRGCGHCPWYNPSLDTASNLGCPAK